MILFGDFNKCCKVLASLIKTQKTGKLWILGLLIEYGYTILKLEISICQISY